MAEISTTMGAFVQPAEQPDAPETQLHTLFSALEAGDAGVLDEIFRQVSGELYALALWRTGCSADAADAVQDVFIALATTRARLSRVRRPRAYLFRMTHRAAARIARRRTPTEPLDDLVLPAPGMGSETRALARQAAGHLAALLARQREVVLLHLLLGLNFREIGTVTGVSRFTAASRYRLGLRRLRRLMGVAP